MEYLLNNAVSSELLIVYGLIAIVVIFIIVIIIIDKRESKKKPQNLFDTLNMKIIADPYAVLEEQEERKLKEQVEQLEIDITEIEPSNIEDEFKDLEPIEEIKIFDSNINLKQTINEIENEVYIEDDLEKTQAQLCVEEITKALEFAQLDEMVEKDKYEQFEEEQEKNAIISYNELKESFDKLYMENEKIQYLEDDEIPINIEELYRLHDEQEKQKASIKLEEFNIKKEVQKSQTQTQSSFKSSPYISPVYGIQTPPVEFNHVDKEIESTNQFLQSLKELKGNLD